MMTPRLLIALPQNFSFLAKLPSRFMATVVADKGMVNGVRVYELKIQGSILRLRSQVPLPVSETITVEKTSDLGKLKLLTKTPDRITEKINTTAPPDAPGIADSSFSETLPVWQKVFTSLALAIWEREKNRPEFQGLGEKFGFSLQGDVPLHGVFVPFKSGLVNRYRLYLHVANADEEDAKQLAEILKDFNIESVSLVSRDTIDLISRGVKSIV